MSRSLAYGQPKHSRDRATAAASFIALLAACLSLPVSASDWVLTDLGTLGGSESFAYGINDLGQVVGMSRTTGDSSTHAFLYRNGQMMDLYPLNSEGVQTVGPSRINDLGQIASGVMSAGVYSPAIYDSSSHSISVLGSLGGVTSYGFNGVATAINNSGQAVGYSYVDAFNRHASFYQNGTTTDLGSFGGFSVALDLNASGVAVGFASDRVSGVSVASLWSAGGIKAICGNTESLARAINDRGQVVGELFNSSASALHAFLYSDGSVTELGTLPTGRNSSGYAINSRGQVVGNADVISSIDAILDPGSGRVYYQTNYAQHAFLYDHGSIMDLNGLISTNSGWELNYAQDVNESGQIVGYGSLDGNFHAYLLTPIPEPSAVALAGIGTAALVFSRWRRRRS